MHFWLIAMLSTMLWGERFQPIDVNLASRDQLMTLPGVGAKLADRILLQRQKVRRFQGQNDLLKIDGFRERLLTSLDGKILFGHLSFQRRLESMDPSLRWGDKDKAKAHEIDIESLLANFADEPSVRAVQEQAVAYAHTHPNQVASWLERVRQAAWAPRLTTSGGRQSDLGQSIREKIGDTDVLYKRNSADWSFKAEAQWNLRDLVFNNDELKVAREADRQSKLREHIVMAVTRHYFDRRKLQVEAKLQTQADVEARFKRQLAIAELTAQLDGMTGGWFSEQVAGSEYGN